MPVTRPSSSAPTRDVDPALLAEAVSAALAAHRSDPGPLLPILHAVQSDLGWVPPGAVPLIAAELNLTRADVHGVVTFYHDFRDRPPARHTLRICRAEACQSVGARELVAHAEQTYGVPLGEVSADDGFALEQVFCLGNCALGPTVEIDGRMHGRVDAGRLDDLLAEEVRP